MRAPHGSARDEAFDVGTARAGGNDRHTHGEGAIVHCFVDAGEMRRLLALLVATEMATAVIHAALSG